AATVSWSPKKSATSGRYPPRRADWASARPETAASNTALLAIDLAGKDVGFVHGQLQRCSGGDHLTEEARLGLVLDVAHRQRADAEGAAGGQLGIFGKCVEAFDSGRRHGVGIDGNEEARGHFELRLGQDLHARAAARGD